MQVLDAYEPTAKFNEIGWAKYEMKLSLEHADEELAHRLEALYTTSPLMMTKKTKSGEREIDQIPLIRSVKVTCEEENTLHITAVLAAGNTEHLNPELIINAAREKCGILSGNPARESYSILRTHVYLADGETEFR